MREYKKGAETMNIRAMVRKFIRKKGFDIVRYRTKTNFNARKIHLLARHGVDLVIDVGANDGGFALSLRANQWYAGEICSFEPLSAAYGALEAAARTDDKWRVFNFGLGDADVEAEINVAANSESSSLLPMLPAHLEAAPHSAYVGRETISIRRLDAVLPEIRGDARSIYLKLDVQGYEDRVLLGAGRALEDIAMIQLEMSLTPLYDGEVPIAEMIGKMTDRNFDLIGFEPGYVDARTGVLHQVDGIFLRSDIAR